MKVVLISTLLVFFTSQESAQAQSFLLITRLLECDSIQMDLLKKLISDGRINGLKALIGFLVIGARSSFSGSKKIPTNIATTSSRQI